MYSINLNQVKEIVASIVAKKKIENVAFVGCGLPRANCIRPSIFCPMPAGS